MFNKQISGAMESEMVLGDKAVLYQWIWARPRKLITEATLGITCVSVCGATWHSSCTASLPQSAIVQCSVDSGVMGVW